MTQKYSFSNEVPGSWRLLGEIELLVGAAGNDHIYMWLVETLRPLKLNDRFLNKILASAELAAVVDRRAGIEAAHEPMHLLIYTPEDSPSNGQSWGFFRVEKKSDLQSADLNPKHAIAFYLYREGL
jgi:hypothetical protein